MNSLVPLKKKGMKPSNTLRLSAGRACHRCRQHRIKCDLGKPCTNCVKAHENCIHVDITTACFCCSRSKVKCDKQRPCARCVKRGKPEECVGPEIEGEEIEVKEERHSETKFAVEQPSTQKSLPETTQPSQQQSHPTVNMFQQCQIGMPIGSTSAAIQIQTTLPCARPEGPSDQSDLLVRSMAPARRPSQPAYDLGHEIEILAEDIMYNSKAANCTVGASTQFSYFDTGAFDKMLEKLLTGNQEIQQETGQCEDPLIFQEDTAMMDVRHAFDSRKRFLDDEITRPGSRSKKRKVSAADTVFLSPGNLRLERPLRARRTLLLQDMGKARNLQGLKLSHKVIRRLWEAGYNHAALCNLFNNLPRSIRNALDRGLAAMEALANLTPKNLQMDSSPKEGIECSTVDHITGRAYWSLKFDPDTMKRQSVQVNADLGKFCNMHPDELLGRAGHSEVFMPHSELEFFCATMDDIVNLMQPVVVRYQRFSRYENGKIVDIILVKRRSIRFFNAAKQVIRIDHVMEAVSPEEFDAARERDPTVCRPFASLGDERSATELIQDGIKDSMFDETFSELASSAQGRRRLRLLKEKMEEKFQVFINMAEQASAAKPHFNPPLGPETREMGISHFEDPMEMECKLHAPAQPVL